MQLEEILRFCVENELITPEQSNQILKTGHIEELPTRAYPLLHLICNQIDSENMSACPYFKLALHLLKLKCNPDVLDKHQKTPLHYAAETGNYLLAKILISSGADVNYLVHDRCALSLSLEKAPHSKKLVRYLYDRTTLTPAIRKDIQETYQEALALWEHDRLYISRIHRCLELKLADIPRQKNDCSELKNGVWIRTISDPQAEVSVLRQRAVLPAHQLSRYPSYQKSSPPCHDTPYSSATFVAEGIPVSLFSMGAKTGVVIRRLNRPVDYFYDGSHGEELTRDFDFRREDWRLHDPKSGHFTQASEDQIFQAVQDINTRSLQAYTTADRYGAVITEYHFLPWNEGLLRYQSSDIIGVLVNPIDNVSAQQALELRTTLNLTVPLYHYQYGCVKRIPSAQLMKDHGLDPTGRCLLPKTAHVLYQQHPSKKTQNEPKP